MTTPRFGFPTTGKRRKTDPGRPVEFYLEFAERLIGVSNSRPPDEDSRDETTTTTKQQAPRARDSNSPRQQPAARRHVRLTHVYAKVELDAAFVTIGKEHQLLAYVSGIILLDTGNDTRTAMPDNPPVDQTPGSFTHVVTFVLFIQHDDDVPDGMKK